MLIIHAHLHTMAGADIADGYLRTEGNQIAELGGMPVEPKPGEEVILSLIHILNPPAHQR